MEDEIKRIEVIIADLPEEERQRAQKKLLNVIVSDLYNGITVDDVLQVKGPTHITYRDRQLDKEQILQLKDSAATYVDSPLWVLLKEDVKYVANRKMFEKSGSFEEMQFGKAALWVVAVIEEKINQLSKL